MKMPVCFITTGSSSVAGGAIAPHCHAKNAKYHRFSNFETDFCPKSENSPPPIGMHNMSNLTLDLEARSETKIDLSLGEDLFFVFLFCFGLHLFSGSKTVSILGDDLFLFDLHLQNSPPPIVSSWLRD